MHTVFSSLCVGASGRVFRTSRDAFWKDDRCNKNTAVIMLRLEIRDVHTNSHYYVFQSIFGVPQTDMDKISALS